MLNTSRMMYCIREIPGKVFSFSWCIWIFRRHTQSHQRRIDHPKMVELEEEKRWPSSQEKTTLLQYLEIFTKSMTIHFKISIFSYILNYVSILILNHYVVLIDEHWPNGMLFELKSLYGNLSCILEIINLYVPSVFLKTNWTKWNW